VRETRQNPLTPGRLLAVRAVFFCGIVIAVGVVNHFGLAIGLAAALAIAAGMRWLFGSLGARSTRNTTQTVAISLFLVAAGFGILAEVDHSDTLWYVAIGVFPVAGLLWRAIQAIGRGRHENAR